MNLWHEHIIISQYARKRENRFIATIRSTAPRQEAAPLAGFVDLEMQKMTVRVIEMDGTGASCGIGAPLSMGQVVSRVTCLVRISHRWRTRVPATLTLLPWRHVDRRPVLQESWPPAEYCNSPSDEDSWSGPTLMVLISVHVVYAEATKARCLVCVRCYAYTFRP
ncbi:hypothetical protein CPB85DRAFT_278626 [Mucidula mucida]|nr:hypothetical protein CPB85DRAFT_278626 [Mucidula mucida]